MQEGDRCGGPSYGRATTSRCPHKADRKGGDRYCPACRAACMREYRQRVKDRRLHAVVVRLCNDASRETIAESHTP